MSIDPEQAAEALHAIEQAKVVAARYSQNNGVVQLVWGCVIFICLVGFDVFPRLAALFVRTGVAIGIGVAIAAVVTGLAAGGTAAWTAAYAKKLPVHPFKVENPRLFLWWGMYYAVIVLLGTIGGALLFGSRASFLPPFWFTVMGLICAAPLLISGWRMWRRAHTAHGQER